MSFDILCEVATFALVGLFVAVSIWSVIEVRRIERDTNARIERMKQPLWYMHRGGDSK